ncbi:hypothetical protein BKA65DRAFT_579079 [Rhexocercosporidium sp. MPI-PUGE-AT-0058]|nr:hypothetical protein BKA65DRAFT_579079 [Rhexocercosporidium sp. MPI-PUGE-AT-0058]
MEQYSLRKTLWFINHDHINYKNSLFVTLVRPMAFLQAPTVLWASLAYSVTVGGFTAVGVLVPQLFSSPPYNFSSGAQGLFGLSRLIGILIGGSLGSKIVDMFNLRREQRRLRQGRAHKPEERLVMLIIPAIFATTGLILYGAFTKKQLYWLGPAFAFGMHCFGPTVLSSICFSYVVDSYPVRCGEVMVFMNVCRCLLTFAFADVSPGWLGKADPLIVYGTLSGITGLFILLGIPVYFYGPWLREKTNRSL